MDQTYERLDAQRKDIEQQLATQREKCQNSKQSLKTTLLDQLRSPMFLIIAICFTVMTASFVISSLQSGISGIFSNILPLIFIIIATVGLWNAYSAHKGKDLAKSMRQASIYDAYNRVIYSITMWLIGIGGVLLAVGCFIGSSSLSSLLGSMGEEGAEVGGAASNIGIIVGIVILVIFAIITTIYALFRNIYKNRRKYFIALGEVETKGYTQEKAPVVGSIVLGVISCLGIIPSIVLAVSSSAIVAFVGELLAAMGEEMGEMAGEIESLVNSLIASVVTGAIFSSILDIVNGAYNILLAVWMSKVHKAELAAHQSIAEEDSRLHQLEEEEKRINQEQKEALERRDRQEREALHDQQAMLQQMMLQQMMANNQTNNAHQVETHTQDDKEEN